jgi:ubiquinone/menaquinone biosynthesis C-methylase UbiE
MADSHATVLGDSRRWVASRAVGKTLEVGVGAWPSLSFYPADVVLVGLDCRSGAVAKANRVVRRSGRSATAVQGDAMALSHSDASFDTVVFSFSLCGVPDVGGALLEALRVLRPGGSLLMADHVVSTSRPLRIVQRVAETLTAPIVGEHFTRRPSLVARELDIAIVTIERLGRGAIERLHATKPS